MCLKTFTQTGLRWLWLTLIVLLLDRFTKIAALKYLTPYNPLELFSHFNLMLAFNRGAAFSFLNNGGGWQMWLLGGIAFVVSIVIIGILKRTPLQQRGFNIGLALILGGALGNFCDRLLYGYVVDFLDVYAGQWHWPTFNIADSAVCLGAVIVLLSMRKNKTA